MRFDPERQVEHRPGGGGSEHDGGCCFEVHLVHRRSLIAALLKPILGFFRPVAVRLTGVGSASEILSAESETWTQVATLPSSVTWKPGGFIPYGDPSEKWVIPEEFQIRFTHPGGTKTVKAEWLAKSGAVVAVQTVSPPCTEPPESDDPRFPDVEWIDFVHFDKGPRSTFAVLEATDCEDEGPEEKLQGDCVIPIERVDCSTTIRLSLPSQPPDTLDWDIAEDTEVASGGLQDLPKDITLDNKVYFLNAGGCDPQKIDLRKLELSLDYTQGCSTDLHMVATVKDGGEADSGSWKWTTTAGELAPSGSHADIKNLVVGDRATVTVTANDTWGCPTTAVKTVQVEGAKVVIRSAHYSWCDSDAGNRELTIPVLPVTFDVDVVAGCPPFTYAFEYGDGETGPNLSHAYKNVQNDGKLRTVKVTLKDGGGNTAIDEFVLKLSARMAPDFSLDWCADGKVVVATSDPNPEWTPLNGSPKVSKLLSRSRADGGRRVYKYKDGGTYTIMMDSTRSVDGNNNSCPAPSQTFVLVKECCTKNHRKAVAHGAAFTASVHRGSSSTSRSRTMRVEAHFWCVNSPVQHRIKAKTKLQRKSSAGFWYGLKSPDVEIGATFAGTLSKRNGGWVLGCSCADPAPTAATDVATNKHKVKAVDAIHESFRLKANSVQAESYAKHDGTKKSVVTWALGPNFPDPHECDDYNAWFDWY